jgi:excisionase family DNA binding protein
VQTTTEFFDDRPLLLRIPEAAALLGIGRSSVYELIALGALETVHIGRSCRVPREAVERYVEQLRRTTR